MRVYPQSLLFSRVTEASASASPPAASAPAPHLHVPPHHNVPTWIQPCQPCPSRWHPLLLPNPQNQSFHHLKALRLVTPYLPSVNLCWLFQIAFFTCSKKASKKTCSMVFLRDKIAADCLTVSQIILPTVFVEHQPFPSHQGSPLISMTFQRR